MSSIFKASRSSLQCMKRVFSVSCQSNIRYMYGIQQNSMRLFGGSGGDTVDHSPEYDRNKNDVNNPYLWDPSYVPCDESDFDRDPQEVRLREPLPKESFLPSSDVLDRICHVLRGMERAQVDGKQLNMDTHLQNDLALDSLDQVEFGLALEDEFDIEIPDEEAEQIVTIGDAVELISDHPHAK